MRNKSQQQPNQLKKNLGKNCGK